MSRPWGLPILFLGLLALAAVPRARNVLVSVPYVQFDDERRVLGPAAEMVETGDLDPDWFRYPTFPMYVAAAGLKAGVLATGAEGPGKVAPFYYERPEVALFVRLLYVAIGLAGMSWAALAAARAFDEPWLAPLCLVVLAGSPLVLRHSWSYVNVDILAAAVCVGTLAYLQRTWQRTGALHRALLPGLLTGMATASKYYMGLVGVPFLLALWWGERRKRDAALIVLATAVAFVVCMPYALLNADTFLYDIGRELQHYTTGGHGEGAVPRGPAHLWLNVQVLAAQLGWGGLALAALGVWQGLRTAPRRSALLLSFPLALTLFLSCQLTHFPRNLLVVVFLLSGPIALGVLVTARALAARAGRPFVGYVVALVALALALPWREVAPEWIRPVDSRTRAARWVAEHVAPDVPVVIAAEAHMDPRPLAALRGDVRVQSLDVVLRVRIPSTLRSDEPLVAVLPPEHVHPEGSLPEGSRRARAALELLASFGARPVPQDHWLVRRWGDPMVEILTVPTGSTSGAGGLPRSGR